MRRLTLTTTFALVSSIAMAVLGVVLVLLSRELLQQQALTQARRTAEAYVRVGVQQTTGPHMYGPGLIPADVARQMNELFRSRADSDLRAVRLWSADGTLIFDSACPRCLDSDSVQVGGIPDQRFEQVVGAAGGSLAARVTEVGSEGQTETRVDVYVPVRFEGQARSSGVAEVVLSYDETAAAVARGVRTLVPVIAGGLLLLWLLLFRTVRRASRRVRLQAHENARLAFLDPLTGLPNRRLLNDRLERACAIATRTNQHVALLLLDVDRFKEVNDTLGHPRGDSLLLQVADRLRGTVRESDTVSRLGGDEFAILLPVVGSVEDAQTFMARVENVFAEPFDLDGLVLHVEASVGLALLPDHADDVTTLMARADVAMYTAKAGGLGSATYSASGDGNSTSRLVLLGDLRRALDTDQLRMHYQPKIDLRTGEVVGLEALLRWSHPVHGMVPPGQFIPLAEQTGLMHPITARVLGMVCRQMATWRDQGIELAVAVNLSARNLLEPSLDEMVAALLRQHRLPRGVLELEITESAIVEDPVRAALMLARLGDLGVPVSLDDFGIGNTSISQLRTLPLTTIKIDRSFVTDLAVDATGSVLVKAIVDLVHEFGMQAVAEGVEDNVTARRLADMGCDVGQGYHWSRPVAPEDVPTMLDRLAAAHDAAHRAAHAPVPS